MLFKVA